MTKLDNFQEIYADEKNFIDHSRARFSYVRFLDYMLTYDAYIDGSWTPARSGKRFESHDPATGIAFASIAEGDATDVDRAVRAAAAAYAGWRRPGRSSVARSSTVSPTQ